MSVPDEPVDDGWDDAPADGGASGDDEGDEAAADAGGDAPAVAGEAPRKRRRRRRRRREGGDPASPDASTTPSEAAAPAGSSQAQPRPQPQPPRQPQGQRAPQDTRQPQGQRAPQDPRQPQGQRPAQDARQQHGREPRGGDDGGRRRRDRGERRGEGGPGGPTERQRSQPPQTPQNAETSARSAPPRPRRGDDVREARGAVDTGGIHDLYADDLSREHPYAGGDGGRSDAGREEAQSFQPRLDARGSQPSLDDDEPATEAPAIAWGSEDDSPAPPIALAPDLPIDAPASDPDPLTFPLVDGPGAQLGDDIASVVGVRFVPAGRIQWCDAGDTDFAPGERVLVDSERGQRLAWIATVPTRRTVRDRGLRRVIRRANDNDLRGERDGEGDRLHALRVAKDVAASLRLPLKVFRVEKTSGKLNVYYTSDERLDLRDFVREVGQAVGLRLELRQLGVRDEAKAVGGIGSCGLTLCCTTWLPEFVPVSIKMAKDQGLVLSPTKVSGQCGRLKCCLVYEQAGYAELRKGLPKLGKRVIASRGEGRVVEVDVLRQRVRVSYGPGDTEVLPATEVKPMFPSGNQPREPEHDDHEPDSGLPDS